MPTSNSYLLRKYGISLEEKVAIIAEQRGKCAACGRIFDETCRTEVDHEHFKVTAVRAKGSVFADIGLQTSGWYAYTHLVKKPVWAKTKIMAIKLAKKASLRASVRGVLCGGRYAGCNRKIGRIDKIPWLQSVVAYLQNPPARNILKKFQGKSHEANLNSSPSSPVVSSSDLASNGENGHQHKQSV